MSLLKRGSSGVLWTPWDAEISRILRGKRAGQVAELLQPNCAQPATNPASQALASLTQRAEWPYVPLPPSTAAGRDPSALVVVGDREAARGQARDGHPGGWLLNHARAGL